MSSCNQGGPKRHNTVQPVKCNSQGDSSLGGRTGKPEHRKIGKDLTREDFIFLLSMLEGELQARDEVITVLKPEMTDPALLEARYGFKRPEKVLSALQRDSLQAMHDQLEDVYEKPMAKLDRLEEAHRQTSRRMLKQLLEVESSHSRALYRLEEQEKEHRTFIQKSDDLTALLEQDRERSLWSRSRSRARQGFPNTEDTTTTEAPTDLRTLDRKTESLLPRTHGKTLA